MLYYKIKSLTTKGEGHRRREELRNPMVRAGSDVLTCLLLGAEKLTYAYAFTSSVRVLIEKNSKKAHSLSAQIVIPISSIVGTVYLWIQRIYLLLTTQIA